MKKNEFVILIIFLLFFFIITNLYDGFLSLIQYPFIYFMIFNMDKKFGADTVIISIFSDYLNDFYFGITFILFFVLKFIYFKSKKVLPESIFTNFLLVNMIFVFYLFVLLFLNSEFSFMFFIYSFFVNMLFYFAVKFVKERFVVQSAV